MEKFNSTLLIDDDSITNHLSKRLLEKFSIANGIYTVENGEEALKFIVNYDPDFNTCPELMFLDLNMPVMDGLTFLDIYQGLTYLNKGNVVIVMLTNSQDEEVIAKCKEYGVKYFLNKPLTEQKLNQLFEEIALASSMREKVNTNT